ncbi:uncharacterized protein LOC132640408 [Lycium barbarum]|uniref:uncharacterized protein LOC132640408 n=1 Tax=Lycium barbarum TaxID=112863 RepID=UPI00293EADDF|nr:uncharacterized protein LOC132640408 [Lycium barbarum]XP_060212977.1 uncharacterized protein LOC132640408 [Lycium barbarum]XP_060212978.1 uncharacterized protein LOC132640408 [Lycium barbarum]
MPEKVVTAETSNTVKAITFDVGHLYHLNSSDAPGMALVNTVFDGRGYPRWRRSIFLSLSVKRKFGFITGSKNIADSKKYSKTAKVLLDNLESPSPAKRALRFSPRQQ